MTSKSLLSTGRLIAINLLVLCLLLLGLETAAWLGRLELGRPSLGWLVRFHEADPSDPLSAGHPCKRMKTHPVLSHVSDHGGRCRIRGGVIRDQFAFYGDDPAAPAVVTLGGSTTSGFDQVYSDGYTYPLLLHGLMQSRGYQVINGGLAAYSSVQELQKLLLDVRRLTAPVKVIVSLSGINDIAGYQGDEETRRLRYPYMSSFQYWMYTSQIWVDQRRVAVTVLPNMGALARSVGRHLFDTARKEGTPDLPYAPVSPAQRWLSNVEAMHGVAEAMGARYFVFLQPIMGLTGVQSVLPADNASKDFRLLAAILRNKDYISRLNAFYDEAKPACARLSYCIDITDVAPPTGINYDDHRHHNQNGNALIAKAVFATIKGALAPSPQATAR